MPWLRTLVRVGGVSGVALFAGASYVAYVYRPRSSAEVDFHEKLRGSDRTPSGFVEQSLHVLARTLALGIVSSVFSAWMHGAHDVEILDGDKLWRHLDTDRGGRALVTVTNHSSVLDDPALISAITPASTRWSPRRMRWSICTEEICFAHPALSAFFGAGKALPAQRGGSIHQKGLATLMRKANNGDWVHVFSEGRVWQEGGTPFRDADGRWCSASGRCADPWSKAGPFKWGVGKLIANAEKGAVIVPFFHWGMSSVMPQDKNNDLITVAPKMSGARVTVMMGDPVVVDDLIDTYHRDARARAIARNRHREAMLQQHTAGGAPGQAVGTRTWWQWLGGAKPQASAPSAVPASALPRAVKAVPGPVPVNTVEEASDHTGESARIAALMTSDSRPSDRLAAGKAALQADEARVPGGDDTPDAEQLRKRLALAVKDAEERAVATAREVEQAALEGARKLETKAMETAREIEAKAKELVEKLRALGLRRDDEPSAAPGAAAPAPDNSPSVREKLTSGAREFVTALKARWAQSISVPKPESFKVGSASSPAALAPDSTPAAAPTAYPADAQFRTRTPPVAATGSSPFPLSDEPVVELVPTRTLRTGAVVPMYIEAPLHIKPPDHEYLSPEEAIMEEDIRLKLYSDIANRIQQAVAAVSVKVMEHRRARGIIEDRPMLQQPWEPLQ